MKKQISIIANIISVIVILTSLNAAHLVAYFLIAGQIPGTNLAIDGGFMLVLFMMLIGFMTGRLCMRIASATTQTKFTRQQA